jgi:SSS family solute:Na+ symporter
VGAESFIKGGYISVVHMYPSEMAQGFWTAIFSFGSCLLVTVVVSLATKQKKTEEELKGLVYSLTPQPREEVPFHKQPALLAGVVLAMTLVLNLVFF